VSIDLTSKLTDMAIDAIDRKPSPDVADCDCCGVRPGTHEVVFAGMDTWICDECSDITPRRPRFHTRDDYEAYEAGVRAQGEI
jgi:hypothetical protein